MTKREFLKTAAFGATASLGAAAFPGAAASLAFPLAVRGDEEIKPVELKNTSFSWVRGFNYQPGYGDDTGGYEDGTGWSIWRDLRTDIIEKELTRGKELFPAMTAVRIWLPYNVWLVQPKKFLNDFSKYIGIIGKLKLRVMVCMFNVWHGTPDFGGFRQASFSRLTKEQLDKTFKFADDLLDRHGDDPTIYAWDLCNEPNFWVTYDVYSPWLKRLYGHIKSRKEKTVLTVSPSGGADIEVYEPISDLISIHPYFVDWDPNWRPLPITTNPEAQLKRYLDIQNRRVNLANSVNKPLVGTELGWGDIDDALRIKRLNVELSALNERKIGWLIHALQHSPVADLHRPETGPVDIAGYMACIEADGSMRPHHEVINDYLNYK